MVHSWLLKTLAQAVKLWVQYRTVFQYARKSKCISVSLKYGTLTCVKRLCCSSCLFGKMVGLQGILMYLQTCLDVVRKPEAIRMFFCWDMFKRLRAKNFKSTIYLRVLWLKYKVQIPLKLIEENAIIQSTECMTAVMNWRTSISTSQKSSTCCEKEFKWLQSSCNYRTTRKSIILQSSWVIRQFQNILNQFLFIYGGGEQNKVFFLFLMNKWLDSSYIWTFRNMIHFICTL